MHAFKIFDQGKLTAKRLIVLLLLRLQEGEAVLVTPSLKKQPFQGTRASHKPFKGHVLLLQWQQQPF